MQLPWHLSSVRISAVLLVLFVSAHAQEWGAPVWQDVFDRPAGSSPDPKNWTFDIGDIKVNHEVEIYCPAFPFDKTQAAPRFDAAWKEIAACNPNAGNVSFDGKHLVLRATESNGVWTSGRIKTADRQTFQYGRVEASMKLPFGAGIWPAFWALGDNIGKAGWPGCGEIDFMENVPQIGGLGPERIRSTIHGPGYSGDNGVRNDFLWKGGERVDSAFHTYGAIWSPYMIQFYVDDPRNIFFVATPRELPAGKEWVYNHPFFLILNLAVGSAKSWSGATDATTPNPAELLVDYVRVYKAKTINGPKFEVAPITFRSGTATDFSAKLIAARGSGRMYLDCLTVAPGLTCSVKDYVVDFTSASEATVTLHLASQVSPPERTEVVLTAYTISGEQSSVKIPVAVE